MTRRSRRTKEKRPAAPAIAQPAPPPPDDLPPVVESTVSPQPTVRAVPVRAVPVLPPRRSAPSRVRLLALWPAFVAAAIFLGLMTHEIVAIKAKEGGRFVYPIDDAYGHLATAKNLFRHGQWTYNAAHDFESSVSSLIWPPLIALCFAFVGVHEYVPLVLNILVGVGLLLYASAALRRVGSPGLLTLLTLVGIILLVPLCAVASVGMEHSLQLLLTIVFLDLAARLLADDAATLTDRRTPFWLCLVGTLLVTTRYEGLFQIAAVGLLLLCRRRWRLALVLGVVAVTPITLFGLYSLHKGWYFLPDSLLMKGNTTHLTPTLAGLAQYFSRGYTTMMSEPHVPAIVLAGAVALFGTLQRRWNLWTYPALVLILALLTAAQHFQFAALGWFYRYEAYLIGLLVFGVGAAVGQARAGEPASSWLRPVGAVYTLALALAVFLFGAPMWPRAINCYPHIISGSYSIYGQQYQMGRFVRRFYEGKGVMANDVCAISYLSDNVDLFDFVGLSDVEALRLKLNGQMNPAAIRRLIGQHHCHVAIVFDTWIQGMLGGPLPEWVKLGTWTIPYNTVSAGDTIAFYATDKEWVPEVQSTLQRFASELPKDIRQEGVYRGADSLNPAGIYEPPGGPKDATHYWSAETAEFGVFPADDQEIGVPDTVLNLAVCTVNQNQTFDIYFNDELVLTKPFTPEECVRWLSFPVKVTWRAGRNVVKLVGHGNAVVRPPDTRPLLFATLDPRRMITGTGAIVPQPGVMQPKD